MTRSLTGLPRIHEGGGGLLDERGRPVLVVDHDGEPSVVLAPTPTPDYDPDDPGVALRVAQAQGMLVACATVGLDPSWVSATVSPFNLILSVAGINVVRHEQARALIDACGLDGQAATVESYGSGDHMTVTGEAFGRTEVVTLVVIGIKRDTCTCCGQPVAGRPS